MRGSSRIVAVMLILLAGLSGAALAQGTVSGSIQGTVKATGGEALPGAIVTVTSDALIGGKATAVTDEKGGYRFPSLPVGAYVIEAKLDGFLTVSREGVRVRLGSALGIDLELPASSVSETITVSGAAPVISVVNNSVATNFDAEFIEKQPLPRNYYAIIKSAPGVNADYTSSSGSAMLAYGGTTESQNAFTLDGVNVADAAAGQHWILPSIQWMEEIQIGGLGANAEYGGYTGGVINGVTKSGGNVTKGGLEVYYEPASWVSNNDPNGSQQEFKFSDYTASLGGKLIQDKLWYFVSGEYQQSVTTPLGALNTSDRKIPRVLGKLTMQANESNRISLMTEWDSVVNERRGISSATLAEASSKQKAPGVSISLGWEALVNANNFANLRLTGYDGRDDYLPYNGENTPGRIDENTGIAWVNQDIRELNHRSIKTLDGSWSWFKDGLFGESDSHAFKFGGLIERAKSSDLWLRNGGFTYYDDSSSCDSFEAYLADPSCGAYYKERGWGEYRARPKYDGMAFYAQDSLRLDRVTINAGLRYGAYQGGWQSGHGDSKVYDESFIDPRIGLVWDLRGDARSAIKLHFGRYHDKMYTYLFDREASGEAVVPDQDCYFDSDTGAYDDCDTATRVAARMGEIEHPYVDETLLSFEQQVGDTMVIGIDLADRRFRSIMAMVNANNDYDRYTGTNPLTGGTFPIYDLVSEQDWVLTTDNGAYRDFRSATLRMDRRYANGWSARGSVVWTDLDGNIRKNNGYANEYRDINGLYNADGKLDLSFSEWEVKFSGAVDLPLGFQASGQYTFLSGWYWTPYGRVSGLDYNWLTGRDINLVPRGSEQLPDRQLIDLRLAWGTKLGEAMHMTASVEVFNVLNEDTVVDTWNRYGTYRLSRGTWTPRSDFGTAYQIERPREIRAGLRFEF